MQIFYKFFLTFFKSLWWVHFCWMFLQNRNFGDAIAVQNVRGIHLWNCVWCSPSNQNSGSAPAYPPNIRVQETPWSGQHNHASDSVDVEVRKLRKRRYEEEALSSIELTQSVAATALAKVPMVVKAEMPRTSCLLMSVRRAS